MNKKEILEKSPTNYGEQMAFYSVGCCWWTSFPEDLGKTSDFGGFPNGFQTVYPDGSKSEPIKNHPGLPCCPHCGAVLMQAPLEDFIKTAEDNPSHYGEHGIETFYKTHHRNSKHCHRHWEDYWKKEE